MTVTIDGTLGVTTPAILNANGNGVGNIGNSSTFFNTVFAKATSAQYADLGEKYVADLAYAVGTVVEIGGEREITATRSFASPRVVGVVSSNPAFIMNSGETSPTAVVVALMGRVPTRVVGTIRRGDLLCSSDIPGVATALPAGNYVPGAVIGKALEDFDQQQEGVIEVLAGRP